MSISFQIFITEFLVLMNFILTLADLWIQLRTFRFKVVLLISIANDTKVAIFVPPIDKLAETEAAMISYLTPSNHIHFVR